MTKKETKEFTRLSHQQSHNLLDRRVKEFPRDSEFDLDRLTHGGIIFAPVRYALSIGKKTSVCSKKVLRDYAQAETLHSEKQRI